MRVTSAQVAFSAGELSPLLHRRFDFQRFQTGLAACRGFLPLRQGGFTRAPGTWWRGRTRGDAPARLVPFEFAENDAVVLEFTDLAMRVWRYGAPVMAGASPYELATPFPEASLGALQWVQSADVIYITDGQRPVQKLSRFALDNWTIAPAAFDTGPFRVQNIDRARTLQASATTGTVTLTASAPGLFTAAHVGSLFRLSPQDNAAIPLWTGNTNVSVGQKMRYDGKTYQLTAGTNTGVNPPVHDEGIEQVSLSPVVKWEYLDNGAGIVRITAVASATSATATVIKTLPQAVVDGPSYRWEEGAWSNVHGWPSLLEIHEQRLAAAATPADPRTIWFSAVGDFAEFEPGVEADSAFAYTIAGEATINRILWLKRGRAGLHIGALGEEYSTRSTERGQSIGPTTAAFGFDSAIGSRGGIRPIAPDGRPIFVSKDGGRVFEIAYSFEADANQASELSLPSEHIAARGIAEIAWQSAPLRMAWFRLSDGNLAAMIHDPQQEVLGWSLLPMAGGTVESLAVSPDATGGADVLTMVVARTLNGATVRGIEELALPFGILSEETPLHEACHLQAALRLSPGAPATAFSLPHLAGETVHAWTDAGSYGPLAVAPDGSVTLPWPVTHATFGLLDATHLAETLDLLGASPDGSPMGRRRRLSPHVIVGLHRTAAGSVRAVERDIGAAERALPAQDLVRRTVAADQAAVLSGVARIEIASGHAAELALRFAPVGGAPMTVTAIVPPVSEGGA